MKYFTNTGFLAAAILVGLGLSQPSAHAQQTGNGGGGIERNGQYMSFYTAGLYVEPVANSTTNLPSLDYLERFIDWMPFLTDSTKADLVDIVVPSPKHQYFSIDSTQFDDTTRARILAEFERVTKVSVANLKLYAITDTNSGHTYLFPEFFQLSPLDQTTILFHECYWLMHPDTSYADVVAAEMAFEAVLVKPSDTLRIQDLMSHIGSSLSDQLLFVASSDLQSGALKGLVDSRGNVGFEALFGEQYLECEKTSIARRRNFPASVMEASASVGGEDYRPCENLLEIQFSRLVRKYSQSLLLRFLQNNLSRMVVKVNRADACEFTKLECLPYSCTGSDSDSASIEALLRAGESDWTIPHGANLFTQLFGTEFRVYESWVKPLQASDSLNINPVRANNESGQFFTSLTAKIHGHKTAFWIKN